jgi:arsenite-transporting ATPase
VAERLWAQETDIYHNLKTHWGTVQEWLNAVLVRQGGVDTLVADELSVLPGMDELANLLWINSHRESGEYDLIVVDAAPTGETLRLLSFPDVMRWWMERIFPWHRRAMGVARPLLGTLIDLPLPSDEVYASLEDLFARLDELHRMLVDPQLTSVRLVVNPEKMVIAESQRTYTYFNLFGYPCDLVVVNRVLPDAVTDPYFAAWKDIQAAHLRHIEEGFSPLPIRTAPLFGNEVLGLPALREMAGAVFGEEDPTRRYFAGQTQRIEPDPEGGYRLVIPLPFTTRGDVGLRQSGDELFVRVGAYRRHLVLPRTLVGHRPSGAKMDEAGHALVVRFRPAEPAGDRPAEPAGDRPAEPAGDRPAEPAPPGAGA